MKQNAHNLLEMEKKDSILTFDPGTCTATAYGAEVVSANLKLATFGRCSFWHTEPN